MEEKNLSIKERVRASIILAAVGDIIGFKWEA